VKKKRTAQVIDDFFDRHTLKEAESNGATVLILDEGRTAEGAVKDGATLDGRSFHWKTILLHPRIAQCVAIH